MAFSPPETLRAHPGISISSLSAASRYRCSADKSYDKNCRCHWLSNASGCMVRKAARPLGLRTLSTSLSVGRISVRRKLCSTMNPVTTSANSSASASGCDTSPRRKDRLSARQWLSEVERVLKPSGRAAFLTMHPDAFESQWHLQFLSYDAGLVLTDERDLWIDRETAVQMFGIGSIGCMPTTPTYWMLTLAKSGAVTDGHADAALLNGFISEHQAA